jgi:hypothetical protein
MKKLIFATLTACVFAFGLTTFAENKNILIKSYPNVVVNDTSNFQVNSAGDIATYNFSKDDNGIITAIYYTYTRKSGTSVSGRIGIGPAGKSYNFIPANTVAFEIVGLERNAALVLFSDKVGSKIYMVFKLAANYAAPTFNCVKPINHIALANEVCSLTSTQIISYLDIPAVVKAVSRRSRTSDIAELTTLEPHGLMIGDKITVLNVLDVAHNNYNLANIEVISATTSTFTYSCPGEDEALTDSTGTAYRPQIYNSVNLYNYNWTALANKGISNQWGALSIINLGMQKYYKGISPTVYPYELEVSILKP